MKTASTLMTKHQYSLRYQSEHIRRARTPRWMQQPSNFRGLVWKTKNKEQTVRTCWQAGAGSKQLSLDKPCFSWARRIKNLTLKIDGALLWWWPICWQWKMNSGMCGSNFGKVNSFCTFEVQRPSGGRERCVFCVWQEQNRALVQTVQPAWRGAVDQNQQNYSRFDFIWRQLIY